MNLHQASISELRQALDQKDVSSVELTQHFLARINQFDSQINSYLEITNDLALAQAVAADERIAKGDTAPLLGIPIAHKDIFCTQGVKTTCASKMLGNFIPPYDATVVSNLSLAGMVTLGKTNMDEFAMGSSNETSAFGDCHNPWQPGRTPGGSSGGSAAAVAASLAPVSTGSDTGGSIRQPAAHCGLTGLKPTYGAISRWGMIAFASSLDQAGPIGRSAADIAPLLSAMVSHDRRDSTSSKHPVSDFSKHINKGVKGLKIGIPTQFFSADLNTKIADTVMQAAEALVKLGAELVPVELNNNHLSLASYYVIAPAEASANLARFDGVRYGYRCEHPNDLTDLYMRSRSEGFGTEVKRRILIGTYALSAGYYDAYYKKAQQVRRLIKNDFSQAFEQVDLILGPTTPNTAFKLGAKNNDITAMYLEDIFTLAVNLAGLPAMSLPCGFIEGLPVGLQLIANTHKEETMLQAAHAYQQVTKWHREASPISQQEVTI